MAGEGLAYRRCGCMDPVTGRQFGGRCPRLAGGHHGSWYVRLELPAGLDGRRRRIRRGGYPSRRAAAAVLARLRAPRPGDAGGRVLRVAQLADRIHVGTTPVVGAREDALEAVEIAEDLFARGRVRRRDVSEARDQICRDEIVLGRVVVIERALADARLGGDSVDADGADPVVIEEPVRRGQDAFSRGGAFGVGRGHL